MGQTMCGGAREEPNRTLDLAIFDNSKHFCALRKGSPYYRKKIRRAEKRVENAKRIYEDYKETKLQRAEDKVYKNKHRSNSS